VQNYHFFRDLNVAQIYAIRRMLEPELAAGAVAHLTGADFEALEHSIHTGGHDVVAASPSSGVNSITGEGLKEAMAGAQVVIRPTARR
jgi:hypothetical protein